jgi:acetyl esterase
MNEGFNISKISKKAKIMAGVLCFAIIFPALGYIAFQTSPWPGALLIRWVFDKEAHSASVALEKHLPAGISAKLNEHYDPSDEDAYLDVFYPSAIEDSDRVLPTIVWIHGGGWLSGSKGQIANYSKILASKSFTVVSVDYSIAPGAIYPTPIRQVNTSLSYLERNARRLHIDSSQFVLAGDSGGAHIAAQVANIITAPSYAKALGLMPAIKRSQLNGLILFCGAYDVGSVHLDGPFGSF